jgi:hypothetical protein
MRYKVYFSSNARKVVECDIYVSDDKWIVFLKDGQPVLSCVVANVNCVGPYDEDDLVPVPLNAQVGTFRSPV